MTDRTPGPVLDHGTLDRLVEDLECRAAVVRVARLYRDNLAARVSRLDAALSGGDHDAAIQVVHTLRVASAMLGAVWVQRCAEHVLDGLSEGDVGVASAGLRRLHVAGPTTAWALEAFVRAA